MFTDVFVLAFGLSLVGAPKATELPQAAKTANTVSVEEALSAKHRDLEMREEKVRQAEIDLKNMEVLLKTQIAELTRLISTHEEFRIEIAKKIDNARKEIIDEKIQRLVEIASKMPPENAAKYLAGLEERTAASIVKGMSARKAAQALGLMDAKKAAALSKRYLDDDELPKAGSDRDAQPASAKPSADPEPRAAAKPNAAPDKSGAGSKPSAAPKPQS